MAESSASLVIAPQKSAQKKCGVGSVFTSAGVGGSVGQ